MVAALLVCGKGYLVPVVCVCQRGGLHWVRIGWVRIENWVNEKWVGRTRLSGLPAIMRMPCSMVGPGLVDERAGGAGVRAGLCVWRYQGCVYEMRASK